LQIRSQNVSGILKNIIVLDIKVNDIDVYIKLK